MGRLLQSATEQTHRSIIIVDDEKSAALWLQTHVHLMVTFLSTNIPGGVLHYICLIGTGLKWGLGSGLPFKDQKSANSVKSEMQNLSAKIGVQIKPVFQSKKICQVLSPKEKKPPIVNNQCVVYKFQCDLCDSDYVGYTTRHLHQRIGEHKHSAIGRHLEDHGLSKSDLKDKQFSVLRKCRSKFVYLIFEMLFIKELKPGLNIQKDSVRAKLFT